MTMVYIFYDSHPVVYIFQLLKNIEAKNGIQTLFKKKTTNNLSQFFISKFNHQQEEETSDILFFI